MDSSRGNALCFPMLVDMDFSVHKGIKTGAIYGLTIKNSQRKLHIKCKNSSQVNEWYDCISDMKKNTGEDFCNIYQRHKSFAPVRKNQFCKWFVNASQYMEQALEAIISAKEEIFITDWWFSPEIYLKRPSKDLQNRLDKILIQKSVDCFFFLKMNYLLIYFYFKRERMLRFTYYYTKNSKLKLEILK